jgi:hypothetical protein
VLTNILSRYTMGDLTFNIFLYGQKMNSRDSSVRLTRRRFKIVTERFFMNSLNSYCSSMNFHDLNLYRRLKTSAWDSRVEKGTKRKCRSINER